MSDNVEIDIQDETPEVIEVIVDPTAAQVAIDAAAFATLTLSQIQSILQNIGQFNAIIQDNGFEIDSGVFKAAAGTIWNIIGVQYTNPILVEIPIALASTGMQRFYRIVLNTNNTFQLISGDESVDYPAIPNKGLDQLDYTVVLVTDSEIGTPSTPIVGDSFVKKIYSGAESSFVSGSDISFPLPANGKSFLSFTNPLLTSLSGFNLDLIAGVSGAEVPYELKDFMIFNNKNTPLTLNHYDDDNAPIWFKLTNDTDLVIPAFGIVHIKYSSGGCFDLYKSWISAVVDISGKLDKETAVDVEKVYIKNADGTQGVKPTSDFQNNLNYPSSDGKTYGVKNGVIQEIVSGGSSELWIYNQHTKLTLSVLNTWYGGNRSSIGYLGSATTFGTGTEPVFPFSALVPMMNLPTGYLVDEIWMQLTDKASNYTSSTLEIFVQREETDGTTQSNIGINPVTIAKGTLSTTTGSAHTLRRYQKIPINPHSLPTRDFSYLQFSIRETLNTQEVYVALAIKLKKG